MLNTLANVLDRASTIVLVIPGSTDKLSESLQEMLNQMTLTFGKVLWDYLVIGVSFWHFDQDSIDDRSSVCTESPEACMNETYFARKVDALMQQSFNLERNFTYLFMDSSSQIVGPPDFNTVDEIQQLNWVKQAGQLRLLTNNREEPFTFWTVDDTRQENARMQSQLKDLDNQMQSLREYVEALVQPPIGSIMPWYGRDLSNTSLPNGWQLCDGSLISDEKSPMFNQTTPNLNGVGDNGLFIRGGSESEAGVIEEDALKNHSHDALGHNHAVKMICTSVIIMYCAGRRASPQLPRKGCGGHGIGFCSGLLQLYVWSPHQWT